MKCRHCLSHATSIFLDLGFSPPSNSYLSSQSLSSPETYYPLRLFVCTKCWLAQTDDFASAEEMFSEDYAYFSSVSSTWVSHAAEYSGMITRKLNLDNQSFVIEIASNDGYLLRNFVNSGIPCLGIEPTASTAAVAEALHIPVWRKFFGVGTAQELTKDGLQADLILGNNVYAHVPDINDFTNGLRIALKANGTITLEFPHLLQLLNKSQFDTVYHEHFSYLSLTSVSKIFYAAGLRVFDVETLKTHGGSLRIYGCHLGDSRTNSPAIINMMEEENEFGITTLTRYQAFQGNVDDIKDGLLTFLIDQKRAGNTVWGYGAAAKGCTLLNYAGVKSDLLPFICDAAPSKQGKFTPGSHIPIVHPKQISLSKPDILLIFPWNIKEEVMEQTSYIRDWGGTWAVAIPSIQILSA